MSSSDSREIMRRALFIAENLICYVYNYVEEDERQDVSRPYLSHLLKMVREEADRLGRIDPDSIDFDKYSEEMQLYRKSQMELGTFEAARIRMRSIMERLNANGYGSGYGSEDLYHSLNHLELWLTLGDDVPFLLPESIYKPFIPPSKGEYNL